METARELVGRQVLRNFGRHGIHKGTIISFDDDGELTFRVEYQDGDAEDLAEEDVRETLIDKRIVQVASRSRRDKDAEDSESDYFPEDASSDEHVNEVISSQSNNSTSRVDNFRWDKSTNDHCSLCGADHEDSDFEPDSSPSSIISDSNVRTDEDESPDEVEEESPAIGSVVSSQTSLLGLEYGNDSDCSTTSLLVN